jgi:hypothetical protein
MAVSVGRCSVSNPRAGARLDRILPGANTVTVTVTVTVTEVVLDAVADNSTSARANVSGSRRRPSSSQTCCLQ